MQLNVASKPRRTLADHLWLVYRKAFALSTPPSPAGPPLSILAHERAVRDGVERHSSLLHLLALRVHLLLLAALAVIADEGAVRVGV